MPTNHRMDCTCSVCSQKRTGKAKRADLERKREAIRKMQESHRLIKSINRIETLATMSASYATIAYNMAKIALWTIPTLLGIALLVRAFMYIF